MGPDKIKLLKHLPVKLVGCQPTEMVKPTWKLCKVWCIMRICKTCIYVNIRLCFNMHNNDPRSPMLHHNIGKQVHYTLDVCTDIYLINQTKDWILLLLKLGKYPTQISIIQKRCQHAVSKLDFSWTSYHFKAIRSTKWCHHLYT